MQFRLPRSVQFPRLVFLCNTVANYLTMPVRRVTNSLLTVNAFYSTTVPVLHSSQANHGESRAALFSDFLLIDELTRLHFQFLLGDTVFWTVQYCTTLLNRRYLDNRDSIFHSQCSTEANWASRQQIAVTQHHYTLRGHLHLSNLVPSHSSHHETDLLAAQHHDDDYDGVSDGIDHCMRSFARYPNVGRSHESTCSSAATTTTIRRKYYAVSLSNRGQSCLSRCVRR